MTRRVWLVAVAALAAALAPGAVPAQTPAPEVRIGVIQSLFRDIPEPLAEVLLQPFRVLLKNQTGLTSRISRAADADTLGKQLHDGKVDFAVFHGFELAWAQQKFPDLRPLMIAVNKHRELRAHLIVRNDSTAKVPADLRGAVVGVPVRNKEHCRIFLDGLCEKQSASIETFFEKVVRPASPEDALDDVIRGKLAAAVVDGVAWEAYAAIKPGCCNRLKCLTLSEAFPASVLAYSRKGGVSAALLKQFSDGMLAANRNARGKELLHLWKLTAFEPVPANYQQSLEHILSIYPPQQPAAAAVADEPRN
jgi:ABC-type phosphate/phosphonate transport system substrate-binding protein